MNAKLVITIENEHPAPTRVTLDELYDPLGFPVPCPCFALLEQFDFEGELQAVDPDEWVYLCEYIIHLGGGATGIEGQVNGANTRLRLLMPGERLVISLSPEG